MKIGKNKVLFISIGLVLILTFYIFFSNSSHPISVSEEVRTNLEKMDEGIQKEVDNHTDLALSSNPYDYIVDNDYYDNIINLGVSALPELEATLKKSKVNLLNEYILAIAIEEITQANVNDILGNTDSGWQSAKEFESEWIAIKANATDNVEAIIQSKELAVEDKLAKIENYGILAVEAIDSYLHAPQSNEKDNVKQELNNLLESFKLSKKDIKIVKDYINK